MLFTSTETICTVRWCTNRNGENIKKKQAIGYTLDTAKESVKIFKDGKYAGSGAIGLESALEAIFVMENMTKEDWLICENGIVYLVDREEFGKSEHCECIDD